MEAAIAFRGQLTKGNHHHMIGMVLAAGAGRRLRPYTDTLPKALVPVDGDTTILDIALRNLAAVELRDVVVVVGYAADAVESRRAALEQRYGVDLTLVHNDKAEIWNNAYSLLAGARPHGRRRPAWSTATPSTRSRSSRRCWRPAARTSCSPSTPTRGWRDEEMKVQRRARRRAARGSPS